MTKSMWMLLVGVAVVAACVVPAVAQEEAEVTETPGEYCGICEAKKVPHEMGLPDWMTFGADLRNRVTYFNNATTLSKSISDHEWLFTRQRARVWAKADLGKLDQGLEHLTIDVRLVWEWFTFCKPDSMDNTPSSDVIFDELHVTWTHVLDEPLTLIVGRQNMRLGDGWLVFEGTPLDGSRTIFFDAIRGIYELPDYNSTVNAIFVANRADADSYIKPFNDGAVESLLSETDESGLILWVANTSQENTQFDGYFIYTHREAPNSNNTLADIYTFGGRVAGNWSDNITYRAEAALQFGAKEDMSGSDANIGGAMGLNTRVTYLLQDQRDTAVHAGYEYRSGDKDPTKSFDILWGRYPQFSEILNAYTDALEGNPAATTNFHRLNVGVTTTPCPDVIVLLNYHILFADNNNISAMGFAENGCLRGNLFTSQVKIAHNEHMASTITAELFLPGDFYTAARNDPATFARYDLTLTW